MEADIDTESASSSPDPLGQPDLSTPLRSPHSRAPGSRRTSRPQHIQIQPSPTPTSRSSASRSASRRGTPAREMPAQRRSPRVSAAARRAQEGAAQEEEALDMAGGGFSDSDSPGSPNQSFLGEPTTTTVPIKTGEETPRKGGKRRPGTPKRKGTPIPRRTANFLEGEVSVDGLEEDGLQVSPSPRRVAGRPQRSPQTQGVGEDVFGPPLQARTRLSPGPTVQVPGASPGKRRRVVSDSSDNFTYSIVKRADKDTEKTTRSGASPRRGSPPAKVRSPRKGASPRLTAANLMASAARLQPSSTAQNFSQAEKLPLDPTDEHDEFDSILESEDFTRVSLSNVPSGQYLRSLMGGSADNSAVANGTTTADSVQVQEPGPSANDLVANPYPQLNKTAESAPSPEPSGLLVGFGSGTKRAMRDALRLGDRLARSRVEAKRAAASTDDTANIWDELAEEESSGASASADPLSSNVHAVVRNHTSAAFPADVAADVGYPQLPLQQPTPEQSDDHDQNGEGEAVDQMSWRYDTPAKARLGLRPSVPLSSQSQRLDDESLPPVPPWSEATSRNDDREQNMERVACAPSSPDKQLFLEQAAYELEAANSRRRQGSVVGSSIGGEEAAEDADEDDEDDRYRDGNADAPIIIDSGDVGSDISSDSDDLEEPPVISEATRSILQDDTDIWADEARESLNESGLEPSLPKLPQPASQQQSKQEPSASSPSQIISPLNMRGALPQPTIELSPARPEAPKEVQRELFPPRRGKLLSMWRRQDGSSPVVYSDEPELPPAEEESELQAPLGLSLKRKLVTPRDARKKPKYNDADFSVLSEFRDVGHRSPALQDGPPSSPTKRVRFESEDPENPYYPTTPVRPAVEAIHEDEGDEEEGEEEEGEEEEQDSEHGHEDEDEDEDVEMEDGEDMSVSEEEPHISPESSRNRPAPLKSSIRWEKKPAPKQGSWLSGWLPSWFHAPKAPLFTFSLPSFARKPAVDPQSPSPPESYEPAPFSGIWTNKDHQALARTYDRAKTRPLPAPESADVKALLGKEIAAVGWRKRVNGWELAVVEEFLQDLDNDRRFTPEDVAIRLFALWATDVQEGRTGLGNGTPGVFCSAYVANRAAVLARARRIKCMAAC